MTTQPAWSTVPSQEPRRVAGRAPPAPHPSTPITGHVAPSPLTRDRGRRTVGHATGSGTVVMTVVDHDRGDRVGALQDHRACCEVEDAPPSAAMLRVTRQVGSMIRVPDATIIPPPTEPGLSSREL